MSRRNLVIALLTIKVKYMVATHAFKEVFRLNILCPYVVFGQHVVRLDCDSQSIIFLYHFVG